MLALAGSGTLPPLFQQIRDQNANVVMHNSAVLLAALCLFVGSLPAAGAAPLQLPGSRDRHLVVAYTAVLACLAIVCTLVATGAVPTFFVPGKGTTTLRSFVLGAALVLFALAATFWWQTYVRTRVPFLRWYYLGLVLFVLGIVTILQVTIVGSAFSWVGRAAQYLAVAYLLVAVLSARSPKSAALVERGFAWSMLQSSLSYRPLVESASEAIGVLDETGRILYWNGAAERLFGYRASDAFGADLVELIVPTARREARAEIAAALSASDPAGGRAGGHLDVTLVDGDGREFPAEAAFYRNLVGANRLTVCMIRDITVRRQAEERLAASEERFRTAFDGAPIGAAIEELNPSPGHFLDVNEAYTDISGYPRGQLLDMTDLDITHPDDRADWAQGLHDLAAHKVDSYHQDKRYTHAGGHTIWVRAHASVIGTDAARRQRAVVYVEDITERRAAEERLQAALTELEQRTGDLTRSNEELEQFAYVASHDLQEPLRMVSSYTTLLAEDLGDSLDDDARRYLDFAHDGAVRMQQLVTDLLQYSRVGRADTGRQRVDCDQLVETATVDLHEAISAAGATVTHDPLPTVIGVPTELRQLFTNLVGNAVKFRGDEPVHVHVGAARDGPMWRFSVADNGIGIDPGQAERIFEVFKRLHTRGRYPGTGIGLAICKKVVEHHGGRIWVESQPGAGATFRFTLPAAGHDQGDR